MDKCPHCGSTSAFIYNATLVTSRMGEWGMKVDEEIRVESSVFPKTVKCSDCGKRVNFDLAHGVAVEHSVQRIWGTVAQNEDLPNEKMCATCGHSESRHQTAGGFCKHCTCNEFADPATTPNR